MELLAIGPGKTSKITKATEIVEDWLQKNAKKLEPTRGVNWTTTNYEVQFVRFGRKVGYPTRVEVYIDRNGFHAVTLFGENKRTLQAWRLNFRKMGGYKVKNPSRKWHKERVAQLEKAMPYSKRGEYGRGQYDEAVYAEKPGLPNPKFKFGPTGFRPPRKWFYKMARSSALSYFSKPLKLLSAKQKARVSKIVGGIWAKYTDATRMDILKKYEPSAVRALANPSLLGTKIEMLNCPACNGLNPVSRLNVYLKCNTCGAPLRSVRVRHKR